MGSTVALAIAAIYALLPTLISLFTSASVGGMQAVMNDKLFKANGNTIEILEDLFGYNSSLNYWNVQIFGVDIRFNSLHVGQMIMELAYALVVLLMFVQVIASLINAAQGEESENPIKIMIRALATLFLIVVFFGTPGNRWLPASGIIHWYGDVMSAVLSGVTQDYSKFFEGLKDLVHISVSLIPSRQIIICIFSFALFKGSLEAGLVFVERWLTFTFTVLLGPLFIGFNAAKTTSQTFVNWLKQIIAQTITLFVSYLVIIMYMNSMGDLWGVDIGFGDLLFRYAVSIALLALYKNSEKLLNAVGISTVANMSSLREYGKGVQGMASLWRNTGGAILRGAELMAGRQLAGEFFSRTASAARSRFGEDSWISKATASLSPRTSADIISSNNGVKAAADGKYTASNISNRAQRNALSDAAGRVNTKFDSGAGATISTKDVSKLNGLGELSKFKVGSSGVVGEATVNTVTGSGIKYDQKVPGAVFRGSFDEQGYGSSPKTYMVANGPVIQKGTGVSLGSYGDNGLDLSYRVSGAKPVAMQNNQGYMYEIEASPMSQKQFDQSSLASREYSYSQYRDDFNRYNEEIVSSMEQKGFDYAWKFEASQQISEAMFGDAKDTDKPVSTYTSLTQIFSSNSEEKSDYEEEARRDLLDQLEKEELLDQMNDDDISGTDDFNEAQ